MTHQEIDELAPKLEARINAAIAQAHPHWSRYAVDQAVEAIVAQLAPDWDVIRMSVINGVPQMRLLRYNGPLV